MSTQSNKTGVVLMTYGSATTALHVEEYFGRIYGGKASAALIADFENRYRLVGRSPLIDITKKQAALLEQQLGSGYIVRAGMRHSVPFIEEAVAACRAAGATSLIGIVLSPQFSTFIMGGYRTAFVEAARQQDFVESQTAIVGPWSDELHFIELLAKRVNEALTELNKKYGASVPVIFTTHSLPQRVVNKNPEYLQQLQTTIGAVRAKLAPELTWYAAYQSAGHTPEEWLKPDLTDRLEQLRGKTPAVLIAPIQFLADHLEVLYDLDIAARKQCAERGIAYHRIAMPNTDPLFITCLEALVCSLEKSLPRTK